jgi:predicted acyl esterase
MPRLRRVLLLTVALAVPSISRAQSSDTALDSVFERREVMIPMRDGVSLFTLILTPHSRTDSLPIIMSRTPYGTGGWGGTYGILKGFKELIADGYTFVFQDIRGRFKSQGRFLMNHPPRDPHDPKATDESTDTYDSIDWLVRNVP